MVLEDAAADEEGNPLPRVVILPPPTEAVPGDDGDARESTKSDAADVPGQVRCISQSVPATPPSFCTHNPVRTLLARRYTDAEQPQVCDVEPKQCDDYLGPFQI